MQNAMIERRIIPIILAAFLSPGDATVACGLVACPGFQWWLQFRQVITRLLLPMVPASSPIPPVSTAPATAFFPLNPFLSACIWSDPHFGHRTLDVLSIVKVIEVKGQIFNIPRNNRRVKTRY
jgi:hypothetical protein